jgi:hypothetical protein
MFSDRSVGYPRVGGGRLFAKRSADLPLQSLLLLTHGGKPSQVWVGALIRAQMLPTLLPRSCQFEVHSWRCRILPSMAIGPSCLGNKAWSGYSCPGSPPVSKLALWEKTKTDVSKMLRMGNLGPSGLFCAGSGQVVGCRWGSKPARQQPAWRVVHQLPQPSLRLAQSALPILNCF